jgi:hypothetical protein
MGKTKSGISFTIGVSVCEKLPEMQFGKYNHSMIVFN